MTNIPYFDDSNAPSDWEERAEAKRRKDEEEYHARANRAAELAAEVARLTAELQAAKAQIKDLIGVTKVVRQERNSYRAALTQSTGD